jgi:hypothetical protein
MNIVGTAYDSEEIEDIEDIIKVFLIGQRMGNLPRHNKTKVLLEKTNMESLKKEVQHNTLVHGYLSNFSVKGLS